MTGPLTYHEAMDLSLRDQIARYEELTDRDLMARSIATLQARGEHDKDKHPDRGEYQPLAVAEHLEMLALGEAIAFYYRHPAGVDHAVRAGATWEQIAGARNTTAEAARAAYRKWAEGQHQYAGMGDNEYAAAIEAAGEPAPAGVTGTAAGHARRLNAIRAVLDRFDWDHGDRQYALEAIDRIADGGQP
jgi:hypothetical protein